MAAPCERAHTPGHEFNVSFRGRFIEASAGSTISLSRTSSGVVEESFKHSSKSEHAHKWPRSRRCCSPSELRSRTLERSGHHPVNHESEFKDSSEALERYARVRFVGNSRALVEHTNRNTRVYNCKTRVLQYSGTATMHTQRSAFHRSHGRHCKDSSKSEHSLLKRCSRRYCSPSELLSLKSKC